MLKSKILNERKSFYNDDRELWTRKRLFDGRLLQLVGCIWYFSQSWRDPVSSAPTIYTIQLLFNSFLSFPRPIWLRNHGSGSVSMRNWSQIFIFSKYAYFGDYLSPASHPSTEKSEKQSPKLCIFAENKNLEKLKRFLNFLLLSYMYVYLY